MQEGTNFHQCLKAQLQRSQGGNLQLLQRTIDESEMVQRVRYGLWKMCLTR